MADARFGVAVVLVIPKNAPTILIERRKRVRVFAAK